MRRPDAVTIDVYTASGAPRRQITVDELKALVVAEYIVAVVSGRKIRHVELTVPPDIAFRQLGETKANVKDQLHTDANVTTQRSAPTLPSFHKRHHTAHCNAWNRYREPLPVGKTMEGISSDAPRGAGAQRESHLLKQVPEVLAAYNSPAISVHQIYSRFRISWDGLAWLLKIHGVELRADHHKRHPVPMVSKLRRFLPYGDEERVELYRRAWGPRWADKPVARGYVSALGVQPGSKCATRKPFVPGENLCK